jgi:hypothetical protein
MPKVNMDYSRTIIYKIVCKDLLVTDMYVGHTTNFIKRKQQHKSRCNNENDRIYNLFVYQTIRYTGGWSNWDMIEIEKYNCNDVNEALKRERYWIEELKATLNKCIPSRTQKEYRNEHKEQKLKYRLDNKEKRSKKFVCECGGKYTHNDKATHFKTIKHLKYLDNLEDI